MKPIALACALAISAMSIAISPALAADAPDAAAKAQPKAAAPAPKSPFKTDKEKFSYIMGLQIGADMKRRQIELDSKALNVGLQDGQAGQQPRISAEEAQATMSAYEKREREKYEALAKKNLESGKAWLEENKKKDGVITLPSGVQYKALREGTGSHPKTGDSVTVHYRGTHIDGREFDSTYRRGEAATIPLSGVVRGWQEVLPLMKEGSKWDVAIPSDLAYGPQGASGAIGPNEALHFEIELIATKETPKGDAAKAAPGK